MENKHLPSLVCHTIVQSIHFKIFTFWSHILMDSTITHRFCFLNCKLRNNKSNNSSYILGNLRKDLNNRKKSLISSQNLHRKDKMTILKSLFFKQNYSLWCVFNVLVLCIGVMSSVYINRHSQNGMVLYNFNVCIYIRTMCTVLNNC